MYLDTKQPKKHQQRFKKYLLDKQQPKQTKMGTLEDKHCQIILKNENDKVNDILMNYDLILRTNDKRTKYEYFDIYNYKDNKMVVGGVPINKRKKL